ncbi:hypothetical protein TELCIR_11373, partial [Teladorsagia circumcincta]
TSTGNRIDDSAAILACIGDTKTSASELGDGQQKAVLQVWWNLVQAFWKKFGPDPIKDEKLTEAMKQWCTEVTKDYDAFFLGELITVVERVLERDGIPTLPNIRKGFAQRALGFAFCGLLSHDSVSIINREKLHWRFARRVKNEGILRKRSESPHSAYDDIEDGINILKRSWLKKDWKG